MPNINEREKNIKNKAFLYFAAALMCPTPLELALTYLVHTGVGKEKGGVIVGDGGGGRDKGVSELVTEVRDEGLADLDSVPLLWVGCHLTWIK